VGIYFDRDPELAGTFHPGDGEIPEYRSLLTPCEVICLARTRLGLTATEVARRARISRGCMARLESGRVARPECQSTRQVLQVLGVPETALFGPVRSLMPPSGYLTWADYQLRALPLAPARARKPLRRLQQRALGRKNKRPPKLRGAVYPEGVPPAKPVGSVKP